MTAFTLRLIALISMLLDHIGYVFFPDQIWLRCIGRLAFPIFAFQLSEGFLHSHDKSRYALRLFLLALSSEIPYDLVTQGMFLSPARQNVLWTLLIALLWLWLMKEAKTFDQNPVIQWLATFLLIFLATSITAAFRLDYGGVGILMIFVFYCLRSKPTWLQVFFIFAVNALIGGPTVHVAGLTLPIQIFASLAMLPISLYRGVRGPTSALWTYFCYSFFPVHLSILALLIHV